MKIRISKFLIKILIIILFTNLYEIIITEKIELKKLKVKIIKIITINLNLNLNLAIGKFCL
jgi:hypothetical protein